MLWRKKEKMQIKDKKKREIISWNDKMEEKRMCGK